MREITSEYVKTSEFWNTSPDEILMFEKTVKECQDMLIDIVDKYKDLLEKLRDA